MTEGRYPILAKEAQAEDRGTKITGVPVDCIIGSA